MTVSSTTSKASYSGNGSTTVFTVPFYFLEAADLQVILRSSAGVETVQTLTTNYTVAGAGVTSGGTVTMLVAPAAGTTLTILRNIEATQETDLVPNDRLPAESLETALDKATMLIQQLDEEAGRSLKYPASDAAMSAQLPAATARASKFLSFDSNGLPVATVGVDATTDIFTQLGTGAVPRSVNSKLREMVSPQDFGAVGDGVTDDTAAVQLAVNYCMTDPVRPKTLLVAGKYLLTSTVNITAVNLSVIAARKNYFRILGIGDGSGFYANSAITMFSSSDYTGVQSTMAMVQWENIAFVGGSTSYIAKVISGAFIQILFNSCVFYQVVCMQTSNVNTFSHWFSNCHIKAWPSNFYELIYVSANDIIFDGCYFNGTAGTNTPAIRLSLVQGFKCTNNTFESMDGVAIVLRGSRACEISGNYFEGCALTAGSYYIDLNEAGTSELAGVSISGNLFFMVSAQDANAAFFAINWDGIAAGSSNGNWCTGRLHRIVNSQPGYDLSINGDTESTTGSLTGRATIRSDRYFDNCEANVLQAIPRANPPSPAFAGQIYYDSDDNKLKCYNGTSWNDLF